jgi:hypothetical protein
MRVHVRILYGADDRFQMVRQTIDVCHPYIHSIRVVNTGPVELASKFKDLPPNTTIDNFNFFFGDLESARNAMLYDVDVGDYVLWLDADERPSQLLLENFEEIERTLDSRGIWSVRFPALNHNWNKHGTPCHDKWELNNRDLFPFDAFDYGDKWLRAERGQGPFPLATTGRMVKKQSHRLGANTNFGGHGNILNVRDVHDMVVTRFPLCHLKHDLMCYQSCATSTYVNPCLNAPIKDGYRPYIQSSQYRSLREFQKRTGVKTQNDLCYKLHLNPDAVFKASLKELFMNEDFKTCTLYENYFRLYHIWADEYDCSWKTPNTFCGRQCCHYKHIQL